MLWYVALCAIPIILLFIVALCKASARGDADIFSASDAAAPPYERGKF